MSEVRKDDVYLCRKDGVTRTITITRAPIFTKRVHAREKQLYAVGLSCVTAHDSQPSLIGKKRRVFISVKDLLKAPYALMVPYGVTITEVKNAPRIGDGDPAHFDAYNRPLSVPVPCGEEVSTVVDGIETVPGF